MPSWLPPLLIAMVGAAIYANSLSVPFVFDDDESIAKNVFILELWPLTNAFKAPAKTTVDGRPVLCLSLAINYAIGGLDVRVYHVTNILIHICAALALFGVVRRTLLTEKIRPTFGDNADGVALAASQLWVAHPLCTQAVTYVIQRAESLMAMFYLLTVYCALRAFQASRSNRWAVASVVACALAMGTKEVAISAPVLVWLIDRTLFAGSFAAALRQRPVFYAAMAGTMLIQVALVLGSPRPDAAGFGTAAQQPLAYLATQFGVIVHYLRLTLWPTGLCIDYAWPIAKTAMEIVPPMILVALLFVATIRAIAIKSAWGIAGAAFFMILAPTSSVLPMMDPIFEHRFYLPLAIVSVSAVCLLAMPLMRMSADIVRRITPLAVMALVVTLGLLTIRRNAVYQTDLGLWQDALAKRPENVRAMVNVGIAHMLAGKDGDAVVVLQKAVDNNPRHAEAQQNLAAALTRLGRFDEAIAHYEECIRLSDNYYQAHFNLALVLEELSRPNDAARHYEEALRIYPEYPEANEKYARLLAKHGHIEEAIAHYGVALRHNPDNAVAHNAIGNLHVRIGRWNEAVEEYKAALALDPDFLEATNNLGATLARLGDTDEAIQLFTSALSRHRDNAMLHANLGTVYLKAGDDESAERAFASALHLDPSCKPAEAGMERLRSRKLRAGDNLLP
jgi:tetratricopeptide (TPR) repeat protein